MRLNGLIPPEEDIVPGICDVRLNDAPTGVMVPTLVQLIRFVLA